MKTPAECARLLLTLLACQLLIPAVAAAYSVQLRWNAPTDGAFTAVLADLAVEKTYTFAVSAYAADGTESERSNERSIGYAQAAFVVDSDGDGLADAEEDVNLNGVRDPGETDRLVADTDGD